MSTDVQRICDTLPSLHEVWASTLEIAIGIWLLSREIGYALIGPVVVTVAAVLGTSLVSTRMGAAQGAWMEAIQARIETTAKMLESMKGVKMLGIAPRMHRLIREMRQHEITKSLAARRLFVVIITFGNVAQGLGPGAAFLIYILAIQDSNQVLDVPRAFTTLSLVALLTAPVGQLIFSFPPLIGSLACVRRIEAFLTTKPRHDSRSSTQPQPTQLDGKATDGVQLQQLPPQVPGSVAIRLHSASFSWNDTDTPVVRNISLDVPNRSHHYIVGPTGCGKSTLLKGILGETTHSTGTTYTRDPEIGFVDQTPWIQQKSIRDNIVMGAELDEAWFITVVRACALDEDLALFPDGAKTLVGSGGHSLSGGQKLRVALARAVYSRRRILLLDDPFSGLDPENESSVFTRLLGKEGLARRLGLTIVLVTNAVDRLHHADTIVEMAADGTVRCTGTLDTLKRNGLFLSEVQIRERVQRQETLKDTDEAEEAKDTIEEVTKQAPKRPTGDIQVYRYYFSASGWHNVLIFGILISMFALCSRFPGEPPIPFIQVCRLTQKQTSR
jgi:ATP-binding cassette, subfamily C (CFTR/MRP), member 1